MSGRLEGKVAIVTGGASGIGRGTVDLFLKEGAKVVAADLQDDKGARMTEELGPDFLYQRTDVTSEEEVKALVDAAVANFGRLDCMFNNAGGVVSKGELHETDMNEANQDVAILFNGVLHGIKHAAPVMIEQGSGSIINTASVAGLMVGFGPHVYSAMKAAVIQLSKTTAMELAPHHVRVNAICPGGITTSIFGRALGLGTQVADQLVDVLKVQFQNMQPVPRAGIPEDIAEAALFLASDGSSFVTGQALAVDGGITLGRMRNPDDGEFDLEKLREALGANDAAD